jgi:hypothetical protein
MSCSVVTFFAIWHGAGPAPDSVILSPNEFGAGHCKGVETHYRASHLVTRSPMAATEGSPYRYPACQDQGADSLVGLGPHILGERPHVLRRVDQLLFCPVTTTDVCVPMRYSTTTTRA